MLKKVLLGKQITNTRYFIEKKQKNSFLLGKTPQKKVSRLEKGLWARGPKSLNFPDGKT